MNIEARFSAFTTLALFLAFLVPGLSMATTGHIRQYSFGFEKGNLVSNWSFESIGLNWEPETSPLSVDPRFNAASICTGCRAVSGSFVGMASGTYLGTGTTSHLYTQLFPVVPSQTYTLSFYYKTTSVTGTVEPTMLFFSSPENGGVGPSQTVAGSAYQGSPDWRLYSMTFTPDSASLYAKIVLLSTTVSGEGGTFYFDDVVLEEGALSSAAIAAGRFQISEAVSFGDALGRVHQTHSKISSGARNPYPEWKYVKPLFINTTPTGTNTSGTVTNFPLLVRLSNANFNFAEALGAGADLRFAKSSGDTLPYEIEHWDSAGATATVWVKLDTVYGNTQGQAFRMYWGKSGATSQSNPSGVFKSGGTGGGNNFVGVWHLSDNAANATVKNALGTNDGTMQSAGANSNTSNHTVSGQVGKALNFDGNNDFYFHDLQLPKSTGTISHWLKADQLRDMAAYYESNGTSAGYNGFGYSGDALEINSGMYNGGADWSFDYQDGTSEKEILAGAPTTSAFVHVTMTWNRSGSAYLYANGVQIGSVLMSGATFTSKTANTKKMGRVGDGTASRYWDGKVDEVEVSDVARDSTWIKLTYETQKTGAQFLSAGAAESNLEGTTNPFPAWAHSRKATVNTSSTGANISSTVTNFPLLIRLNASNFDFSEAKSDGSDLRFARGTTSLAYEIEHWDPAAEEGVIWVKVDSVFGKNGTQTITAYWGNSSAVAVSSGTAVFDSSQGFGGVWHLNESPIGGVDAIRDRTQWASHGTTGGSMAFSDTATGVVGRAIRFDGTNDYVDIGDSLNVVRQVGAVTLSAWLNLHATTPSGDRTILGFSITGSTPTTVSRANFVVENEKIRAGGRSTDAEGWVNAITNNQLSLNTWYQVSAVVDYANDSILIYINGSKWATTGSMNFTNTSTPSNFSRSNKMAGDEDLSQGFLAAILDEVVVSRLRRSPDWIKLSYENQKSGSAVVSWGVSYPGWAYTSEVSINTTSGGANVSGNNVGFPLLVRLTSGNFDFDQAQAGGGDLRFSKANGTPLPYEIEEWNPGSGLASIWVKVDTIYGNNSSQYIRMHWGNPDAPNQSNPYVVFKPGLTGGGNGYKMAWHLGDDASSAVVSDATGTSNGTLMSGGSSSNTSLHTTSGNIGKAVDLDGTDDHIVHDLQLPKTTGSISHWLKADQLRNMIAYYESDGTSANHNGYGQASQNILEINTGLFNSGADWNFAYQDNAWSEINAGTPTTSSWVHVAATWNRSGSAYLYVDGVQIGTTTLSSLSFTSKTATGKQYGKVGDGTASRYWDGKMDQLEVSEVARSADWIKLSYETQKSGSGVVKVGEFAPNSVASSLPKYRIQETFFDEFGRSQKNFLPVPVETESPSFVPGVPALANAYYKAQLGRPEASDIAFSEILYPDSSQAVQQAFPGDSWKMGGSHTEKSNHYYRGNLTVPSNIENPSTDSAEHHYRFSWSKNSDSNYTLTWTNRRGQVVQVASNLNRSGSDASAWSWAFTKHEHFKAGQAKKAKTPLDIDGANEKFVEVANFNSQGLPVATKTQGKGLVKMWFNRQGSIRFSQDAGQRGNNEYTFTDYDSRGRVITSGIQILSSLSQSLADLDAYSGGAKTEHVGFLYDDLSTFQSRTGFHIDTIMPNLVLENTFNRLVCSYNFNHESTMPGFVAKDKFVATFYSYDPRGKVVSTFKYIGPIRAQNKRRQEASILYDELDRMESKTVYKAEGDVVVSSLHSYQFDEARRLKSVTGLQAKPLSEYTYEDWGPVKSHLLGGDGSGGTGTRLDYAYHIRGWMKEIQATQVGTEKIIHQQFLGYEGKAYEASSVPNLTQARFTGQITQLINKYASDLNSLNPVRLFHYDYDELGRMVRADYMRNSNATPLNSDESINFGTLDLINIDSLDSYLNYDKNGRISGQRTGGVASGDSAQYIYRDSLYQLERVTGKVIPDPPRNMSRMNNFQYDLRGSMTVDSSKDFKAFYGWNMMPNKFQLDHASGADTAQYYFYDAEGNRVSAFLTSTASGSEKRFSAKHYVADWKEWREGYNSSEILSDSVEIIALLGGAVGRIRSNGAYEYYVKNNLGSIVRVVGEEGGFLGDTGSAYDYYAYGNSMNLKAPAEVVSEKYTGKEYEDMSRLYYFGARYLDPELGVWISPDPAGQYRNPYSYVGGDAVNKVDPDGLIGVYVNGIGGRRSPQFEADICRELGPEYCGTTNTKGEPSAFWAHNYFANPDRDVETNVGIHFSVDLGLAIIPGGGIFSGAQAYRGMERAHNARADGEPLHVVSTSGGSSSAGWAITMMNLNYGYGTVTSHTRYTPGPDWVGTGFSSLSGTRLRSYYNVQDNTTVSYLGAAADLTNPFTLISQPSHNFGALNMDNWCLEGSHAPELNCRTVNDMLKDRVWGYEYAVKPFDWTMQGADAYADAGKRGVVESIRGNFGADTKPTPYYERDITGGGRTRIGERSTIQKVLDFFTFH